MRRGRKGGHNKNDYTYKGGRGSQRLPMGGWGWARRNENGTDDQDERLLGNFKKDWWAWWSDVNSRKESFYWYNREKLNDQ